MAKKRKLKAKGVEQPPKPIRPLRTHVNNAMRNPANAKMSVTLQLIRSMKGFRLGIGLMGPVLWSKSMMLGDASRLIVAMERKYGTNETHRLPFGVSDDIDEVLNNLTI